MNDFRYDYNNNGMYRGYPDPQQTQLKKMKDSVKKSMAVMLAVCCIASVSLGAAGGYFAASLTKDNNSFQQNMSAPVGTETTYTFSLSTDSSGKTLADVIEQISSSVVAINVESTASTGLGYFFGGGKTVSSAGSGVIISEDGYIVTNHHVIDGARTITVYLEDGTAYTASIKGADEENDLALLKIEATGLNYAQMGDSDSLRVGDTAIAIGNPLGELAGSVSRGIISALDRQISLDGETMNLLQTDAAINPGNSGGALFNENGKIIGIVVAKSSGDNIEGLGFAIPVNDVKEVVKDLYTYGYVTGRPALGANFVDILDSMTAAMYRVNRLGVYVLGTEDGSAAEKAGLLPGDCVTAMNGTKVADSDAIDRILEQCQVGDTVTMTILRSSRGSQQEMEISIVLGEKVPGTVAGSVVKATR